MCAYLVLYFNVMLCLICDSYECLKLMVSMVSYPEPGLWIVIACIGIWLIALFDFLMLYSGCGSEHKVETVESLIK